MAKRHRNRVIAVLCAVVVLSAADGFLPHGDARERTPRGDTRLFDVQVLRYDWVGSDRQQRVDHSLWGAVRFGYNPDPRGTRYLNVSARVPNQAGSWVVQNLPIVGSRTRSRVVEVELVPFDLSELGVQEGQPLSGICVTALLGFELLDFPPAQPPSQPPTEPTEPPAAEECGPVESHEYQAGDAPEVLPPGEETLQPEAPEPIRNRSRVTVLGANRKQTFRSVQEEHLHCMAGSIARSLDWLNREYRLGVRASAQQIYHTLAQQGVAAAPKGVDIPEIEGRRLAAKKQVTDQHFGGRIVTKVWDPGNNVNTPQGMAESNEDFGEWLRREWETEDVEVAFRRNGVAHIVTLTEVTLDARGHFIVRFRDDEGQGDHTFGDKDHVVKRAPVFKHNGKWFIGANGWEVHFAVSESVTPRREGSVQRRSLRTRWTRFR